MKGNWGVKLNPPIQKLNTEKVVHVSQTVLKTVEKALGNIQMG